MSFSSSVDFEIIFQSPLFRRTVYDVLEENLHLKVKDEVRKEVRSQLADKLPNAIDNTLKNDLSLRIDSYVVNNLNVNNAVKQVESKVEAKSREIMSRISNDDVKQSEIFGAFMANQRIRNDNALQDLKSENNRQHDINNREIKEFKYDIKGGLNSTQNHATVNTLAIIGVVAYLFTRDK